ncbi:MAG: hypothetical protein COZ90_00440 [Candidatus Nealsonbacteria bacterium CG_4_8_14_3_um_filter_37_36]|uniref:Uncharacterized protein n=4 Tax=Candidatus Nealsoniibacteriota TaxID=1817911 RepID=A0A2M7EBB7_9BACT|nr:MAG: hypothetical protein COS09_01765 [Candidatus Nealsonbacteria bacterium CG01_land_8_20_14_3_00_12]PIW35089.1 MAG: hypothetical protein COW25_01075 [Candidatus Nealsonbacteria bacterium CG15_BIG_FIL_POST_REV_8_21_14_020_37_12]PIW91553.1 MAG: hypothetical protein COZ90_00440 [Candidatus Nealsonbacteria bacterium CG_4_8_14_3_um_filter_37_36]PJA83403.1 MAG: hypothetical protein CO146_01285 [Candidatus Nealsonbacteria bacterium CG_4_9_14_3_um_filter_37_29]
MAIKKPTPPPKPAPISKGPYEKRGGIPREKFPYFLKKGPSSIPWSRNVKSRQLGAMGEKLLKERFPSYYGRELSGSEIQREIGKLKNAFPRAKTGTEQNTIREAIARLEEAKKRAGL